MVLKVSKGGVRSGNKLKGVNNSYHRNYRRHGVIVRNLILTGETIERKNFLGDVDLKTSNIPYSINKKGRWHLPELIKDKIEDGEYDDLKYAVQVVERHKLLRKSNCFRLHTSQTPKGWKDGEKSRERDIGYLNANSILNPRNERYTRRERARRERARWQRYRRARNRNGRNHWDDDSEDEEDEDEPRVTPSSVRYEVLLPPSPTSGLNYTRCTGGDDYDLNACYCRRRCKCRNKTDCLRRNNFQDFIKEEMEYLESNIIEEDIRNFGEPFRYSSESLDSTTTVNLADFLTNGRPTQCKETKKRRRRKSSSTKSDTEEEIHSNKKIIYERIEPKSEPKEEVFSHEPELEVRTHECNAVLVTLSNKETDTQKLRAEHGDRYIECECWPRKFVIDISERAKNNLPLENMSCADNFHACVVFEWDADNKANTDKDSIYKVMFNTSGAKYLAGHRIETLFDFMETSVEESIQRTIFYMETLPEFSDEGLANHNSAIAWKARSHRTTNVAKSADWDSETYIPNEDFYYSAYLTKTTQHHGETDFVEVSGDATVNGNTKAESLANNELKEVSSLQDKLCDICYEFLDEQRPGTALKACGHWFCNGCWVEYLENRINTASPSLNCPEYNCDELVDPGTSFSLLGLRDIIRHAKYCHDNKVERDNITKWCPNAKCGRVLKVNSDNVKVVSCTCGQTFCFDCLGEPHWPAPCESFTDYYKKLKETGDIGIAPVESLEQVIVNGKNCPHCKKFIEKNGGCPYMACTCGRSFCWGCGKDWNSNTHNTSCYTQGYKNDHDTTQITIEDEKRKGNKKQKWYNIAVKHRTEQHPFKLLKMKTAKPKLVKHISAFMGKSAKRGTLILLDFDGKRRNYAHEQDKLPEYLNEMIDLHQELNRVAESTAVVVDSNTLPQKTVLHMMYIINRLASFADGISKGFLYGLERKPEDLLVMFKKVRIHSIRTLKCLHDTVNKLEL